MVVLEIAIKGRFLESFSDFLSVCPVSFCRSIPLLYVSSTFKPLLVVIFGSSIGRNFPEQWLCIAMLLGGSLMVTDQPPV